MKTATSASGRRIRQARHDGLADDAIGLRPIRTGDPHPITHRSTGGGKGVGAERDLRRASPVDARRQPAARCGRGAARIPDLPPGDRRSPPRCCRPTPPPRPPLSCVSRVLIGPQSLADWLCRRVAGRGVPRPPVRRRGRHEVVEARREHEHRDHDEDPERRAEERGADRERGPAAGPGRARSASPRPPTAARRARRPLAPRHRGASVFERRRARRAVRAPATTEMARTTSRTTARTDRERQTVDADAGIGFRLRRDPDRKPP